MDAIVMLKDEHKQVEKLFKALEKDDLSVVPKICEALTLHAAVEESVFYPAVNKEAEDEQDEIAEAYEEHHLVKILIAELQDLDPADIAYKAKATVLMELVRHHVEEEEDEMFPEVRSQLGRKRLQEIGSDMEAFEKKSGPKLKASA